MHYDGYTFDRRYGKYIPCMRCYRKLPKPFLGRYATLRYLNKRGVRIGTFRLACQLEAAKGSS